MGKSKVAIVYCDSYENEKVYNALKEGFSFLGGISSFVKKEEKILLKPNILKRTNSQSAVTTHPSVFEGVARLLLEEGYEDIYFGDSPGGRGGNTYKAWGECGILESGEKLGLKQGEFDKSTKVDFSKGKVAKSFEICNAALEADSIINICKMKTHALERITGAVKNSYGLIGGLNKGKGHVLYPDSISFAKMLVDLNLYLKPKLHIMDGIVAMEGNGPAAGDKINMNVILISADPVALDSVFSRLVYLNPEFVPTTKIGFEYGLGCYKEKDIDIFTNIKNETLSQLISRLGNKSFNVKREAIGKGKGLIDYFNRFFMDKPYIIKEKCIKCGICVDSCPLEKKAIYHDLEKNEIIYNYKECIKCFCCQEMCPKEAVGVTKSKIGKIFYLHNK